MSDLNYNIAPQNPMQGYMQALQFGSALGEMGFNKRNAQAQAEAQRLAAEEKAMKDAQINEAYKLVRENPNAENYSKLSNLLPAEQAKSVRESFALLDEEKQQALLSESANVFSAFTAGQPEIGIKILEDKAEAYRAAGNEKAVKDTQMLVDLAKSGPMGQEAVKAMFGMNISMMPGGKEAIEGVAKLHEDDRAQDLHSLNKAKLQAEIDKSKEIKEAGGITPEERFNQEEKLRKEYQSRIANFTEMNQTYGNIKASASDKSGAGDLALITGFMKMLDPGSVVRETEFASAQDTAGLMAKLNGSLTKIKNGEFLSDSQRKTFADLAGKYMEGAKNHDAKVKKDMGIIVKNYGLNKDNVFGAEEVNVVTQEDDR